MYIFCYFFFPVDLSAWEEKIHAELDEDENSIDETPPTEEKDGYEMFKGGVLTIGCVGKHCRPYL